MGDLLERCLEKIEITESCWLWTDAPSRYGYGRLSVGGRAGRVRLAHRVVWELLVGPISDGMTLDHLCRVRMCVNPDHLEEVTLKENKERGDSFAAVNARKTHCKRGHSLSDLGNLRQSKLPARVCAICHRLDERSRRQERK